MALEATHIKFALDIKEKYQVKDLDKYLSGTIYPDSRYISGIERTKTHFEESLSSNFLHTDFKKGWAVHFLCDRVQKDFFTETFFDYFRDVTSVGQGSEQWVRMSALKGVFDILLLQQFDIQPFLPYLDYVENPNGEPLDQVKKYNEVIQKLYANKKNVTPQDITQMWLSFGVEEDLALKIEKFTEKYLADGELINRMNIEFYK